MTVREQYRGESKREWVVKPVDPERAHRFVAKDVGRRGTCVICHRREASDWHDAAARQYTVEYQDPGEMDALTRR